MPMEQFMIKPIMAPQFIQLQVRRQNWKRIIPSNYQILDESQYRTIQITIINSVTIKKQHYFPQLYTLFFVIFLSNFLGLIPYSSTPSIEIIAALTVAFTIQIGIQIYGIVTIHGKYILHLFLPAGTPLALIPLMVPQEVIAYLTRTLSQGLRLAVNMITGHILIKVCISFAANMNGPQLLLPLGFTTVFQALEILIAYLQAYIFIYIISVTQKDIT